MLNLAVLLENTASWTPDKTAIIFNDTKLTYAQVNAYASMVAGGLAERGIGVGDKVALSCLNLPYFPIAYYGILKAGATVVPLNVLLKPREIAYHLNDSDAKAYICFEGNDVLPMGTMGHAGFNEVDGCEHFVLITADPAAPSPIEGVQTMGQMMHGQSPDFPSVNTSTEDTAVILYTSGTTGNPKGAELTHSNMVMNARLAENMYASQDNDVSLVVLPLFHSYGQTTQMNSGFYLGQTLTLLPRFDADAALAIMDRDDVTIFAGVPTMYWAILNHPDAQKYDLDKIAKNLRLCFTGGASMPVEVMKDFEAKYGVEILEGYGLSETSPLATFHRLGLERKPGAVGPAVWGVTVKVFDEEGNEVPTGELGEIVIRGHNTMKGYYNKPDATAKAFRTGWFHTGDIGRMDEDGYVYIVDRVKDMLIRGGFNVYPREIEEVLMTHEAVSLATVIGVPDDQYGEEVKAYVILKEGAPAITEDEMIAWSKENMAAYKYPRYIEFRDALPMTATGKILKRELRAELDS